MIQQRAEEFSEESADKDIDPKEINNLLRVGKPVVSTLMSGLWRRMSKQIVDFQHARAVFGFVIGFVVLLDVTRQHAASAPG